MLHEVDRPSAATIHVSPETDPGLDPHHAIGHHDTLH